MYKAVFLSCAGIASSSGPEMRSTIWELRRCRSRMPSSSRKPLSPSTRKTCEAVSSCLHVLFRMALRGGRVYTPHMVVHVQLQIADGEDNHVKHTPREWSSYPCTAPRSSSLLYPWWEVVCATTRRERVKDYRAQCRLCRPLRRVFEASFLTTPLLCMPQH